jgi:hypothetical protein
MRHRKSSSTGAFALVLFSAPFMLVTLAALAQSETQPRLFHNACSGDCVADVNFIHSSMGDNMAKNAYHGWFNSYYTLTGCGDPAWQTDLSFLLDIVGELVDAPGAPTMQCWQGLAAQASLCSDSCSEYFIPDAKYAPNVRLSLDWGAPGALEVSIDNQANLGKLPELEPNAYSRRFHLQTTLQLGDRPAVLINDTEMPSLSFPNWITRGGYSDCLNAYGADDNRCILIERMTAPSVVSTSVEFLDGVFYDLSDQVDNLSDANGSFNQDGFVRLLSNGDSLTINQGDFAGYAWVKTHNLSDDNHSEQLIPWDARNGTLTIINRECNSWLSTCWVTGDRAETDTYVFALQGPAEKRIPGSYTVQVTADIRHEKDFSDNRTSYAYDASEVGNQQGETQEGGDLPDTDIQVEDLPVIDLPGPGIYPNSIPEGVPGVMYRLAVPQGIRFMFLRLVSVDGGGVSYFVRRGSIPVPNYPFIDEDYDCWQQSDASYSGGCPFTNPYPDMYYIFVSRLQGSSFQVEVEWTTSGAAATPTAQPTQEPEAEQQEELSETYTEREVNNDRATANAWDMRLPFTGQVSRTSDRDYVFLTIQQPGIYTFSLTEIGAEMRAKMTLVRASTGNYLDSSQSSTKGAATQLTFDASAGEEYDLIISALSMTSGATNQPYQLSLTGFVPDPNESNDDRPTSTFWDLTQGPIQGYFWDKTTGRADYFRFIAPQTQEGSPVSFEVTNPSPDLRIRLTLINAIGLFQGNTPISNPGQPLTYSKVLEANKEYTLKLETLALKTSMLPYSLSASYSPGSTQSDPTETGQPVRLRGLVFNQGRFLPMPIKDVAIYVQVTGQPAMLLDTTGTLGMYSETVNMAEGQEVHIWAVKAGLTFQPMEDVWSPDGSTRTHRTVFRVVGAQLLQETVTPTPETAGTPLPPLIQTAQVTRKPTRRPSATATAPAATPTPPEAQTHTIISGSLWRLFPESGPAGVGAGRLILNVNGVDQPPVLTMIDGTYSMAVPNLQPGDRLSLRAENTEDEFEPVAYVWQAEAGVGDWSYDFYSYWGTIVPPARDDQNHIFGRIVDSQGQGVPGVHLVLQMGNSDALQRLGPTDANGYYDGYVRLPDRMMVTVWVEQSGFLPSHRIFFHAYAAEDREINFFRPTPADK